MENSYEAIYTGVYIFVFVAALTIALYLFQGINELADVSYDYGKTVTAGGVIETDTEDKKYLTKSDVIVYYCNYVKKDNNEQSSIDFKVNVGLQNLNYKGLMDNLAEGNYELIQTGKNSFEIKQDNYIRRGNFER